MRSSEWQLLQSSTKLFCASVPGMLMSHSALVSCALKFRAGLSLSRSVSPGRRRHWLLRTVEIIAGGADVHRVMAGIEPDGREAEMALVVDDDRDGDRRAVLPGADDDAFHGPSSTELTAPESAAAFCAKAGADGVQHERRQSPRPTRAISSSSAWRPPHPDRARHKATPIRFNSLVFVGA